MLLPALAQEANNMKVIEFKLLESDLTANTYGTSKKDNNGETAALIKIVTPERGFTFDGGSLGIVATEEHTGEIWLYVPRRAQKLIVKHQDYGVLRDYFYPIPIEGGRTYEMLIDIGTGRYTTITSGIAHANIYVDGELCGVSPVRKYLNYGKHTIRATKDRFEGETTATITTGEGQSMRLIQVDMQDISHLFGDVTVTVDNRADIFLDNIKVGTGEWKTQLREGNYTIETRNADSDPSVTSFTVVARQQNTVRANAPIPHTGYLSIYTRPRNVTATMDGNPIDLTERQSVIVGTHQLEFQRKGYHTQNKEYRVVRYETTADTVQLERIKYVKPRAFYFGGGYTLSSMSGLTAMLGTVMYNHDLQLNYTFGMSESNPVHWYGSNGTWQSTTTYKQSGFGVKYGYQFNLMETLAITPQVGYSYAQLDCNVSDGAGSYGDAASAQLGSIGVKLLLVPVHHVYIFAAPQYALPLSKSDNFTLLSDKSDIKADGFSATLGLLFNF